MSVSSPTQMLGELSGYEASCYWSMYLERPEHMAAELSLSTWRSVQPISSIEGLRSRKWPMQPCALMQRVCAASFRGVWRRLFAFGAMGFKLSVQILVVVSEPYLFFVTVALIFLFKMYYLQCVLPFGIPG